MKNLCIIIFTVIISFFASCKKDEPILQEGDPCTLNENQEVEVKCNLKFGDQPIDYQTIYTLDDGTKLQFSCVQIYVSRFAFLPATSGGADQKILLLKPGNESFRVSIPAASYDSIRFTFGLDSLTNHGDPSTYPPGNPLAFTVPSMHWSWNQGYLFARIEGKYDPVSISDSSRNFLYHIGYDSNFQKDIKLPMSLKSSVCETQTASLSFNLKQLFMHLELPTEDHTMSDSNVAVAIKVRKNLILGISTP